MKNISRTISDDERLARLRLARTPGIGPVGWHELIDRCGSGEGALAALPDLAARAGRDFRVPARQSAVRELEMLHKVGGRLLLHGEADYPAALAALPDAPPALSVLGDPELLASTGIAMVGARNASANGLRFAEDMACDFAAAGHVVISGLARGIDAAAHRGALAGGTVAVVAGGVDDVYPRENERLRAAIVERGAVISERPFGAEPQARHFPRRNRIIAGLALGVVVIEAARRSGTLITARRAAEQGREVFAVPGAPGDPRAEGCNDLIKDGAACVTEAAEVLATLPATPSRIPSRRLAGTPPRPAPPVPAPTITSTPPEGPETARAALLAGLGPAPTPVDELTRRCQLSPAVVAEALLELELAGRIERLPGNQAALI